MEELEQRIDALRRLLTGRAVSVVSNEDVVVDLSSGHHPAHAAPGPLLDDLTTPATVVRLEVDVDRRRGPAHAAVSAAEFDERSSGEVAEVIRLQA